MKPFKKFNSILLIIVLMVFCVVPALARVGGAGGGHSSGGHSSGGGGYYHSSGGYYDGSSGSGSGEGRAAVVLIFIFVFFVVLAIIANDKKQATEQSGEQASLPFPEGLDEEKLKTAFFAIQKAWQNKDLSQVRKWLSDGMYQKLSIQQKMMARLDQRNILENISLNAIKPKNIYTDGRYQVAEIAFSFTMDDSFISDKYPVFNESAKADTDTEYWIFVKSINDKHADLYNNNNCPNCGAPIEIQIGEICRCSNCNTLLNSASYDWVLSEIVQKESYSANSIYKNDQLQTLMVQDKFFSVQRMEDIASNIFMQTMDAISGGNENRIHRFASESTLKQIAAIKSKMGGYAFDRLFVNNVTLTQFESAGDYMKFLFKLTAIYRRVSIDERIRFIDDQFKKEKFSMVLVRRKAGPKDEQAYSFECSSCGAPFDDTTSDRCTYCDAPVVDPKRNWVLGNIEIDVAASYDD